MVTKTANSYLGVIEINGQKLRLDLRWDPAVSSPSHNHIFEISRKARKTIFTLAKQEILRAASESQKITASKIRLLSGQGAHLDTGAVLKTNPSFITSLQSALEQEDPIPLPDPSLGNKPDAPFENEFGRAIFRQMEEELSQDKITFESRDLSIPQKCDRKVFASKEDLVRRKTAELAELAGKEYSLSKTWNFKKFKKVNSPTLESMRGVSLSLTPRRHYEMELNLKDDLARFLGRKEPFLSREIFAFNSSFNGCRFEEAGKTVLVEKAISSSFNRFATEPTMMRMVQSEDGTSDIYSGRVDTKGATKLSKASQMAQYIFLSEKSLKEKGKGIKAIDEKKKIYRCRFAVQSLLTLQGKEKKLFQDEQEAYRLLEKNSPLTIEDPEDPSHPFTVYFEQVPIAAVQFNISCHLEKLLPRELSGELFAQEESKKGDEILFKWAAESKDEKVNDTVEFLKSGTLNSWQTVLAKAYLCHLLNIPIVVHCLSSVDRTGLASAAIVAMKQWLRSGKEIPLDQNGKVAIHLLPEIKAKKEDGASFTPFKQLFAFNLIKGMKIGELSRGEKGLKLERGLAQNPILKDLFPEEYLKKKEGSFIHHAAVFITAVLAAVVSLIACLILLGDDYLALSTPLIAFKKTIKNGSDILFPKTVLDESHPDLKNLQLIYKRKLKRET